MAWISQFGSGLSPRWPEFGPRILHVGFVVDKGHCDRFVLDYVCFPVPLSFNQCAIFAHRRRYISLATDSVV